jgi:hypothetical protein
MLRSTWFLFRRKIPFQNGRTRYAERTAVHPGRIIGSRRSFGAIVFIYLWCCPVALISQSTQLHYTIAKGGDEIGWLTLEKQVRANQTTLLLISEIKTRMVLQVIIGVMDKATFENGKLVASNLVRKTNNQTKLNKHTRLLGQKYEVQQKGKKQLLAFPFIGANLLTMYFQEPVGLQSIYSDLHERFIHLKKLKDGCYEVKFPDGNSNCFYYAGGRCIRVTINHTFYTAEVLLKPGT